MSGVNHQNKGQKMAKVKTTGRKCPGCGAIIGTAQKSHRSCGWVKEVKPGYDQAVMMVTRDSKGGMHTSCHHMTAAFAQVMTFIKSHDNGMELLQEVATIDASLRKAGASLADILPINPTAKPANDPQSNDPSDIAQAPPAKVYAPSAEQRQVAVS